MRLHGVPEPLPERKKKVAKYESKNFISFSYFLLLAPKHYTDMARHQILYSIAYFRIKTAALL